MQFVDYNHNTGVMCYRFDLTESFLKGYFGTEKISKQEYDFLFDGAIQMHISYRKSYGPDDVYPLWKFCCLVLTRKNPCGKWFESNRSEQNHKWTYQTLWNTSFLCFIRSCFHRDFDTALAQKSKCNRCAICCKITEILSLIVLKSPLTFFG